MIDIEAKSSLLFHNGKPWVKKEGDGLFDVTMGSWDGAETCELVGSFILDSLKDILPLTHVGLYRYEGLAIINETPREAEKLKKKLCKRFRDMGLQVTANVNTTVVDFLDVTLDLRKKEYKPYVKPDSSQVYVHKDSNHPPVVAKRIPASIQARISNISSNARLFDESKQRYEDALHRAGYNTTLSYSPTTDPGDNQTADSSKRKRKRKIIWFTPPFSKNVSTNIGQLFLEIINRTFPASNSLHKIFNRNSVKISYSCMDNMRAVINKHNKLLLNKHQEREKAKCNCRDKKNCPLPGKCTIDNVIYEAELKTPNKTDIHWSNF